MKMRTFLCFGLAIVLAVGIDAGQTNKKPVVKKPAQVKKPVKAPSVKITSLGQANWKKTSMTLPELARRVSAATMGLKNTTAQLHVSCETPEGIAGFASPSIVLRVKDGMHYRVDYVVLQNVPFSASLISDGNQRRARFDSQLTTFARNAKLPVATKYRGDQLVGVFDFDFTRLAFQGFTEGVDAWQPVLLGWGRGVNGYKATVEERRLTYQGVKYLNYRVVAERVGTAKTKFGPSTFEVVVDGKLFLPVTIRNVRKDTKGGSWQTLWAAMYKFNQKITTAELGFGA